MRRILLMCLASLAVAGASSIAPGPAGSTGGGQSPPGDPGVPVLPAPPEASIGNVPRFALFGWVSPPLAMTAQSRYADMVRAGFNVTLLAWDDTGCVADNRARLDATRALGMRDLLLDNRLDSVYSAVPASLSIADSIVAAYREDAAFMGYYLGDEPADSTFDRLGEWFAILRQRDPAHPAWNSLAGRMGFPSHQAYEDYTRQYVARVHPAILCNSHYDFGVGYDLHELTENVATLATVARQNRLPFWGVVLLVEHGPFRYISDGLLRWQVAQWLAYGARGIGYFTYWTPAPDGYQHWRPAMVTWETGEPTATYDTVMTLNQRVDPIGNTLAGATWLATEHAGSVPPYGTPFVPNAVVAAVNGRATLGFFSDSTHAPLVFVASADSVDPRVVSVRPAGGRTVERLGDAGAGWSPLPQAPDGTVALDMVPGDFVLLRFSGRVEGSILAAPRDAGRAARAHLGVRPNPASAVVRFDLRGGQPGARLVLMDLAGRRIWSETCPAPDATLTWRGEREGGGRAPAGVYLARYEDSRGVTVRRVHWLGDR